MTQAVDNEWSRSTHIAQHNVNIGVIHHSATQRIKIALALNIVVVDNPIQPETAGVAGAHEDAWRRFNERIIDGSIEAGEYRSAECLRFQRAERAGRLMRHQQECNKQGTEQQSIDDTLIAS